MIHGVPAPRGAITSDTLGNGETESWVYNDKRGRLTSYSAILSGTTIYSLTIPSGGYAPNSDILAANDSVNGNVNGNWTYSYDQFNRLVGSNKNSGSAVFSYVYDRFGNRWQQNGPNSFLATFTGNNPGNPQNNNRLDGYSYDASGNLLSDGSHTYSYDAENRITKVDNGNTATYVYDALSRRVEKITASPQNNECTTSSSGTVLYVYDLVGHAEVYTPNGVNTCIDEIYAGGRHLATYSGGGTNFSHSDWLGTERVRRSSNTTTTQYCTSNPFGDALSCSPIGIESPLHFTGKMLDYESGLNNFGARYYSSSMGRWLSPDWSAMEEPVPYAKLDNPQSLNLYGYVLNNPLSQKDDDGHEIIYADGLKNSQLVMDTVTAILANPNTSSYLSGYVGPNSPNLTIQSGDLGPPTVTTLPNGQTLTTTVQGNTAPDISTTSGTRRSFQRMRRLRKGCRTIKDHRRCERMRYELPTKSKSSNRSNR